VCVAAGTIPVAATPHGGFELGPTPWHDTNGDVNKMGDPGVVAGMTSTAQVTVTTGTKCVWACCPFSPMGNGCPASTMDQCP
jgi:hypothetical protein